MWHAGLVTFRCVVGAVYVVVSVCVCVCVCDGGGHSGLSIEARCRIGEHSTNMRQYKHSYNADQWPVS
jgi:hypothetical protein